MRRAAGHVPLTMVQGPPGTGKTSTSVAIIMGWLKLGSGEHGSTELRPSEHGPSRRGLSEHGSSKPGSSGRRSTMGGNERGPAELGSAVGSSSLPPWASDALHPCNANSVLVTAHSNLAVDQVAEALLRRDVRVVRLGNGATALSAISLSALVAASSEGEKIAALRAGGDRAAARELELVVAAQLIRDADVVVGTCMSVGSREAVGATFKYVLMDEAAQVTETAALVPLSMGCEALVLVGDQQQLGPFVSSHMARRLGLCESFFARLLRMKVPSYLLDVQYRMHPEIAAFPSLEFYTGRLRDGVSAAARRPPALLEWPRDKKGAFFGLPLCFVGVGGAGETTERGAHSMR